MGFHSSSTTAVLILLLVVLPLFESAKLDLFCPPDTIPEKKVYDLQIALSSDAAVCRTEQLQFSSRILARLLNEALSNEINIVYTESFVCDDTTAGRRMLGSNYSFNTSVNPAVTSLDENNNQNSDLQAFSPKSLNDNVSNQTRKLYWGRYVYRGGCRCMFCNPDRWDYRRNLASVCNQKDRYLENTHFLKFSWDGRRIRKRYTIPRHSSKAIVSFEILLAEGAKLEFFRFKSRGVNIEVKQDKMMKKKGVSKSSSKKDISWAYKTFVRDSGSIVLSMAIHFPQRYFRKRDGSLEFTLFGKRRGNAGFIRIRNFAVIAREFCDGEKSDDAYKLEMEKRLSKYLTTSLRKKHPNNHCSHKRRLVANVYLVERKNWNNVALQCWK